MWDKRQTYTARASKVTVLASPCRRHRVKGRALVSLADSNCGAEAAVWEASQEVVQRPLLIAMRDSAFGRLTGRCGRQLSLDGVVACEIGLNFQDFMTNHGEQPTGSPIQKMTQMTGDTRKVTRRQGQSE